MDDKSIDALLATAGDVDFLDVDTVPKEEPKLKLTNDQQLAWQFVDQELYNGDAKSVCVKGYAGSGKTTLTGMLIEHFIKTTKYPAERSRADGRPDWFYSVVACVAPTNKAVHTMKKLSPMAGHPKVWFGTLHSFLGLRLHLDETTGEETFKRDKMAEPRKAYLLAVDESSMVSSQLKALTDEAVEGRDVRVLWVGDPAQLPPVGEKLSPTLTDDMSVTLREVVRHGSSIQDCVTAIRKAIEAGDRIPKSVTNFKDGEGIIVSSRDDFLRDAITDFKDDRFREDSSFVQVLAWTNKAVDWGNSLVHRALHGESAPKFVPGQTLVAHTTVMDPIVDRQILMSTSDECVVVSATLLPGADISGGSKYWGLIVKVDNEERELTVIDSDDQVGYLKKVDYLKNLAIRANPKDRSQAWRDYYRLKEEFADLRQCYWRTVHKCVHPNTLVETDAGLLPIGEINKLGGVVATADGPAAYSNYVENEVRPAIKFSLNHGYAITVTPEHKLQLLREAELVMVEANDIRIGDVMRLRLGVVVEPPKPAEMPDQIKGDIRAVEYHTPTELTEDLAEFIGLMVADGTVFHGGFRLLKRHNNVVERFGNLCKSLFGASPKEVNIGDTRGYEVCSTNLAYWLTAIGGMSPNSKFVPDCILRSPSRFHWRFLRGLFEDGTVTLCNRGGMSVADHIEWSTCYPEMAAVVHTMLLRAGIISSSVKRTDRGLSQYMIYIYGNMIGQFSKLIGFVSNFKNTRSTLLRKSNHRLRIPLTDSQVTNLRDAGYLSYGQGADSIKAGSVSRGTAERIVELAGSGHFLHDMLSYHYVAVEEMEQVECESCCIEVPSGNKFLQNGIVGGNSQGATFERVYVATPDIMRNPNDEERGRMLYTSYTRASKQLHVVE